MRCKDAFQKIPLLLDAELTPQEEEQLREHIQGCARCKKAQRETAALLDELDGIPFLELPEQFHAEVMARVFVQEEVQEQKSREKVVKEKISKEFHKKEKTMKLKIPMKNRGISRRFLATAASFLLLAAVLKAASIFLPNKGDMEEAALTTGAGTTYAGKKEDGDTSSAPRVADISVPMESAAQSTPAVQPKVTPAPKPSVPKIARKAAPAAAPSAEKAKGQQVYLDISTEDAAAAEEKIQQEAAALGGIVEAVATEDGMRQLLLTIPTASIQTAKEIISGVGTIHAQEETETEEQVKYSLLQTDKAELQQTEEQLSQTQQETAEKLEDVQAQLQEVDSALSDLEESMSYSVVTIHLQENNGE